MNVHGLEGNISNRNQHLDMMCWSSI